MILNRGPQRRRPGRGGRIRPPAMFAHLSISTETAIEYDEDEMKARQNLKDTVNQHLRKINHASKKHQYVPEPEVKFPVDDMFLIRKAEEADALKMLEDMNEKIRFGTHNTEEIVTLIERLNYWLERNRFEQEVVKALQSSTKSRMAELERQRSLLFSAENSLDAILKK